MKKQRSIAGLLWAAITLLGANAATAQPATSNATVVFYTHGNRATSSLPGTKNGIFWGKLYDGKDLLLNFRQGFFAENNLIIAIAFEPGPHTFSAGYPTMPTKHGQLSLALEPNKTYFVRAESESELFSSNSKKGVSIKCPARSRVRKHKRQRFSAIRNLFRIGEAVSFHCRFRSLALSLPHPTAAPAPRHVPESSDPSPSALSTRITLST